MNSDHLGLGIALALKEAEKEEKEKIWGFFTSGSIILGVYIVGAACFILGSKTAGLASTSLGAAGVIPMAIALVQSFNLYEQVDYQLSLDKPFSSSDEVIECLRKLLKEAQNLAETVQSEGEFLN